jgi:hypothetical protein
MEGEWVGAIAVGEYSAQMRVGSIRQNLADEADPRFSIWVVLTMSSPLEPPVLSITVARHPARPAHPPPSAWLEPLVEPLKPVAVARPLPHPPPTLRQGPIATSRQSSRSTSPTPA